MNQLAGRVDIHSIFKVVSFNRITNIQSTRSLAGRHEAPVAILIVAMLTFAFQDTDQTKWMTQRNVNGHSYWPRHDNCVLIQQDTLTKGKLRKLMTPFVNVKNITAQVAKPYCNVWDWFNITLNAFI